MANRGIVIFRTLKMEHNEARIESRMNAAWIALLLVGAFVALSIIPSRSGIAERTTRTRAVNHVKQLLLGCRAYAADHVEEIFHAVGERGGILPDRILYHPGHTDTGEAKAVLLEHPGEFKGKRIVGYVGGHVAEIPSE